MIVNFRKFYILTFAGAYIPIPRLRITMIQGNSIALLKDPMKTHESDFSMVCRLVTRGRATGSDNGERRSAELKSGTLGLGSRSSDLDQRASGAVSGTQLTMAFGNCA